MTQHNEQRSNGQAVAPITDLSRHPDIGAIMAQAGGPRRQPMRGFDDDYGDIVDYIVRCTHKIWEEGGIGLIYTHYTHNCVVHTPYGMNYSREEVVARSIASLSALPDLRSYADDVIWTGNEDDGFHTSHRNTSVSHNTGYSNYGPPTGRKLQGRGIANCLVKENLIVEEWLVHDGLASVHQMGLDPFAYVDALVAEDVRLGVQPLYSYGDTERTVGQLPPPPVPPRTGDSFDIEAFVRDSMHEIWNWRLFNKITDYYVPNYLCYTSPARTIYGIGDFRAYVMAFLVAFPDAKFNIEQIYWLGDEERGYRVMTRWSLIGTHRGPSVYGKPSGKPVWIMGITHHLVQNGKFVKEWTVFDEIALLKQIRG